MLRQFRTIAQFYRTISCKDSSLVFLSSPFLARTISSTAILRDGRNDDKSGQISSSTSSQGSASNSTRNGGKEEEFGPAKAQEWMKSIEILPPKSAPIAVPGSKGCDPLQVKTDQEGEEKVKEKKSDKKEKDRKDGKDSDRKKKEQKMELSSERLTFIPRRAVMYVPGDDLRKVAKIATLSVDCPVLECEDGVALNKKEDARKNILETLQSADWVQSHLASNRDVAVRVNSLQSGLAEADLSTILASTVLPSTLLIPKIESKDDVSDVYSILNEALKGKEMERPLRLILYIESAKALLGMKKIGKAALKGEGKVVLEGFVFGSDDYCADVGASRTTEATEVMMARQLFVTTVKSFGRGLQAIDLVHIDYKDTADLKRQSEEGARWGFTGKQVIHPGQIDIVQSAFSPSPAKTEWAQELVKAFEDHQQQGKGAFTFRGSMIDRPLLLQAQNILVLSSSLSQSQSSKPEPSSEAASKSTSAR